MGSIERIQREHHQAVLDAHACHLRGEGLTYRQIAREMGCSVPAAHGRVQRAYGRMAGPKAAAERNRMLRELEDLAVAAYDVMERSHVVVNARGVVSMTLVDADGRRHDVPVPDDHPVLAAVARLLRIQERRAKLLGTDAPSKRSVEVVTKTALTAAIDQMQREMDDSGYASGIRPDGVD